MRKTFRLPKPKQREIVAKEVIDGVIFMPEQVANRLKTHIKEEGLREHSATYAGRNGMPLEIISKVFFGIGT